MSREQKTIEAIDGMVELHGKPRPEKFGGGTWNVLVEWGIYKKKVGKKYTKFQWGVFENYLNYKIGERKLWA